MRQNVSTGRAVSIWTLWIGLIGMITPLTATTNIKSASSFLVQTARGLSLRRRYNSSSSDLVFRVWTALLLAGFQEPKMRKTHLIPALIVTLASAFVLVAQEKQPAAKDSANVPAKDEKKPEEKKVD